MKSHNSTHPESPSNGLSIDITTKILAVLILPAVLGIVLRQVIMGEKASLLIRDLHAF